jgi:L-methionine (R)-S-oxide reductase
MQNAADSSACDGETQSEIVLPLIVSGKTIGVLDLDSTELATFDDVDLRGLEGVVRILSEGCDWV